MEKFIDETQNERAIRRVESCTYTMISVIEELEDVESVEERADLLVAIEELYEVSMCLVDEVRGIAWQHTLTPAEISAQEEDNDY
jgi:hypothetical protein